MQEIQEMSVGSLVWEDPKEGEAIHSSILAWRISWTEISWRATVHRVAKSQSQLKLLSMQHA